MLYNSSKNTQTLKLGLVTTTFLAAEHSKIIKIKCQLNIQQNMVQTVKLHTKLQTCLLDGPKC